jgi:hypothetical protein
MPLPHNSATATVIIDGLGICCFNHRRQFWEVGYLRHNHHDHKLLLGIEDALSHPISIGPQDIIRIETINGISFYKDYPDGFFGREPVQDRTKDASLMSADEKENFRWAINLEDPLDEIKHGAGRLMRPPYPVTRAFFENAVFYTQSLPRQDLYNLAETEDGSTMDDPKLKERLFGKTNNLTAGDITCASDGAVNVIIEAGHGHSKIKATLSHRPDNPWRIHLKNMRPGNLSFGGSESHDRHKGSHGELTHPSNNKPEKGDFQLYYDAFNLDDNRKKRALWGRPEIDPLASGRTDCNLVWVGTTDDLDALF